MNDTDVLIIGTGIAGLTLALNAAQKGLRCTLIAKTEPDDNATNNAQGGIAAVLDPADSLASHYDDTVHTGYGLAHLDAVDLLINEGPQAIKELVQWGVKFTRSAESNAWNQLDLAREGGHSKFRIAHSFDRTGAEIQRALLEAVKAHSNITLHPRHTLIELVTDFHLSTPQESPKRDCYGAYIFNRDKGAIEVHLAHYTILATGGLGAIYQHTTNPAAMTGDGMSAAWRAGVQLSNMEFVQFHPTTLFHPDADSFLISEALRGYGAILKDSQGRCFMDEYHTMGSLAPRDVVARAIDKEMKISGEPCVYLDIRHGNASETRTRFPKIYAQCLRFGIDITRDRIPVVPASHYSCGGITVDLKGQSSLPHLYACGEVSCTGVHGANRLASNSLLEAVVFSNNLINSLPLTSSHPLAKLSDITPWDDSGTVLADEWVVVAQPRQEIQRIMSNYVGIVRNDERLNKALDRIHLIRKEVRTLYKKTRVCTAILELRSMVAVAEIVILSALKRKESRGLHYTTDYPETNNELTTDTLLEITR